MDPDCIFRPPTYFKPWQGRDETLLLLGTAVKYSVKAFHTEGNGSLKMAESGPWSSLLTSLAMKSIAGGMVSISCRSARWARARNSSSGEATKCCRSPQG